MLRLSLEKTSLLKLLDSILIENENLVAWTSVDWLARPKNDKKYKKSSRDHYFSNSKSKQYNLQEASFQEGPDWQEVVDVGNGQLKSSASLASLSQFSIDEILNVQTKPIFYGFIVLTEFRLICVKYKVVLQKCRENGRK